MFSRSKKYHNWELYDKTSHENCVLKYYYNKVDEKGRMERTAIIDVKGDTEVFEIPESKIENASIMHEYERFGMSLFIRRGKIEKIVLYKQN